MSKSQNTVLFDCQKIHYVRLYLAKVLIKLVAKKNGNIQYNDFFYLVHNSADGALENAIQHKSANGSKINAVHIMSTDMGNNIV